MRFFWPNMHAWNGAMTILRNCQKLQSWLAGSGVVNVTNWQHCGAHFGCFSVRTYCRRRGKGRFCDNVGYCIFTPVAEWACTTMLLDSLWVGNFSSFPDNVSVACTNDRRTNWHDQLKAAMGHFEKNSVFCMVHAWFNQCLSNSWVWCRLFNQLMILKILN